MPRLCTAHQNVEGSGDTDGTLGLRTYSWSRRRVWTVLDHFDNHRFVHAAGQVIRRKVGTARFDRSDQDARAQHETL